MFLWGWLLTPGSLEAHTIQMFLTTTSREKKPLNLSFGQVSSLPVFHAHVWYLRQRFENSDTANVTNEHQKLV